MKRSLWRAVVLALAAVLLCCACVSIQSPEGSAAVEPLQPSGSAARNETTEMLYVGIMLKSLDNPYFALLKSGAEDAADELGVQVMVVSLGDETDTETEADMLDTMSRMALDVLVFSPSGVIDAEEPLERAEENGKIIMTVDTDLSYDEIACYIGSDHYAAAYSEGEYAAQLAGAGGRAVILRGQAGDGAHDAQETGLRDALTAAGVTVTEVIDWTAEDAAGRLDELLTQEDAPTVICATADSYALDAVDAVAYAGTETAIVSFDAMEEVTACIKDGSIAAAIAQDPYRIGQLCVRTAVQLAQGEDIPREIWTDTTLITAENAAEHLQELENPQASFDSAA